MATISNLVVQISAKSTALTKGLSDARSKVTSFAKGAISSFTKIGLAVTAAFTAATIAVVAMVNNTASSIDELAKTASNLGITVAALQELRFAAGLSGVSNDQLSTSLVKLQKSINDANNGLSTAKRAFDNIGVSLEDLNKLSPAQQFNLVAKAIGGVENQTLAAGSAMDIFGRSGSKLLNLFRSDVDGVTKEFRSLNISLSESQAKAVEVFNDTKTRFGLVFQGFREQVTANVAPAFTAIIQYINATVKEMGGVRAVALRVAKSLVDMAITGVEALAKIPEFFALATSASARFDQFIIGLNIRLTKLKLTILNVGNALGFAFGGEFGTVLTSDIIKAEEDLALLERQSKRTGDEISSMMNAAKDNSAIDSLRGLAKTLQDVRNNVSTGAAISSSSSESSTGAIRSKTVTLSDVQNLIRSGSSSQPISINVDAKTRELFNFVVDNPDFANRINQSVDSRTENARRRVTR